VKSSALGSSALEAIGYKVEWRVLCAADYGDPTTRRRLFVYAVRGRRKIVWPEPTHGPISDQTELMESRLPWVPARQIIDWSVAGQSIYRRKKPLCEKTLRRIKIGLEKFGFAPFIVPQQGYDERVRDLGQALHTVTTECRGIGLVQPFVIGQQSGAAPRSVEEPAPTVATGGAISLVQPFLVHLRGNEDGKSINKPVPAITTSGAHLGLCQPYLVQTNHGNGKDKKGDSRRTRPISSPLPTVAGNRGEWSLCQPFIIATDHTGGNGDYCQGADKPLTAVTTKQRHAVCQPFLVNYYGQSEVSSVENPLGTVTTLDRFGLVQPTIELNGERYLLDIHFRMLRPHELARAQGFPDGYKFTGNISEVVKQIGNAVPAGLSRALVRAALTQQP
jgi:DNA (cytosine-5)-methyltransferase 1